MFELTNDQRKCFALAPIKDEWERIEAKRSPYDQYSTFLYLDSDTIVKCILVGEAQYCEFELSEKISEDRKYLLPKTSKGKPVLLTSAAVLKRNGIGMKLYYKDGYIHLINENTECTYYSNVYRKDVVCDLESFSGWVDNWCGETTEADCVDVLHFSQRQRRHVRYKEGDVFRFKIDRRLYGYGRILLDYDKMRKRKEPFWDILMSKPLVCSVYHIMTQRDDVQIKELKTLGSLPSTIIADNALFYGEYEIIGNLPITEGEDYPIMYGSSIRSGEKAVCYQCGKVFRKMDNRTAVCGGFRNNGVSFSLNCPVDVLDACIAAGSNDPYWKMYYPHWVSGDLRNPINEDKLRMVKKQIGV